MLIVNGTLMFIDDKDVEPSGRVVIPAEVRIVSDVAFFKVRGIVRQIDFEEGAEKIETDACRALTALEVVNFPSTLKSIGPRAFSRCENLKEVAIPESVVSLGEYSFAHCTGLKSVELPESMEKIEHDNVFVGCDNVVTAKIKDYKTYNTGLMMLKCCKNLRELKFPCSISEETFWKYALWKYPEKLSMVSDAVWKNPVSRIALSGVLSRSLRAKYPKDRGNEVYSAIISARDRALGKGSSYIK